MLRVWNKRSIVNRKIKGTGMLKEKKINIALNAEIRNKLQGFKYLEDHIVLYSRVKQEERVKESVSTSTETKLEKDKDYKQRIVLSMSSICVVKRASDHTWTIRWIVKAKRMLKRRDMGIL